jgi:hypothetical protein
MQYHRHRPGLGAAANPNRHTVDLNFDNPGGAIRLARTTATTNFALRYLRFHDRRHEPRPFRVGTGRHWLPRLPAPAEQLLRREPMPARYIRNDSPRDQRLPDNPSFVIIRKTATSPGSSYNFQPVDRLRLKRMVKHRHKPISHSEIATIADHASQKKVGSKQRLRSSGGRSERMPPPIADPN